MLHCPGERLPGSNSSFGKALAVDFRMLAAESAWNQEALFDMFLHIVLEEVKNELAARIYRQILTRSSP
jgi:hypothetical protein